MASTMAEAPSTARFGNQYRELRAGIPSDVLYDYTPLNLDDSIRLLHLELDGNRATTLRGRLVPSRIAAVVGQYEALSYTWGDMTTVLDMSIDGKVLPIGENLANALRRLRAPAGVGWGPTNMLEQRHRLLWVDAICIDQCNDSERTSQVALMRSIFGSARQVLAWLGEDSPDGDGSKAFSELRRMYSELQSRSRLPPTPPKTPETVLGLLQRTWFRRCWIVQEISSAKHVRLLCGSSSLPWLDFSVVIRRLQSIPPHPHSLRTRHQWFEVGIPASQPREHSDRLATLEAFRTFECLDDRDRVAALADLGQPSSRASSYQVDYSISVEANYTDFARRLVAQGSALQVLWHAYRVQAPSTPNAAQMPSWVPDWRLKWRAPHSSVWQDLRLAHDVVVVEENALRVSGYERGSWEQLEHAPGHGVRVPRGLRLELTAPGSKTSMVLILGQQHSSPTRYRLRGVFIDRMGSSVTRDAIHLYDTVAIIV